MKASDPVTISNGYRVTFDDPAGYMASPDTRPPAYSFKATRDVLLTRHIPFSLSRAPALLTIHHNWSLAKVSSSLQK